MRSSNIDCKGTTFFLDNQTYVYKKDWLIYKKDIYCHLETTKVLKFPKMFGCFTEM